jgi:hypothetical protein
LTTRFRALAAIEELSLREDGAIDALIDSIAHSTAMSSLAALEHFHGAVSRIPIDAAVFSHRSSGDTWSPSRIQCESSSKAV